MIFYKPGQNDHVSTWKHSIVFPHGNQLGKMVTPVLHKSKTGNTGVTSVREEIEKKKSLTTRKTDRFSVGFSNYTKNGKNRETAAGELSRFHHEEKATYLSPVRTWP
jgi:hypothetical protein